MVHFHWYRSRVDQPLVDMRFAASKIWKSRSQCDAAISAKRRLSSFALMTLKENPRRRTTSPRHASSVISVWAQETPHQNCASQQSISAFFLAFYFFLEF